MSSSTSRSRALCPYIVGDEPAGTVLARFSEISHAHDGLVVSSDDGFTVVYRDGEA